MKRIESIEVARGIAAILVVFFHASAIIGLEKYYGAVPVDHFWKFGYAGVDFFFVLSGFVIYYSSAKGLELKKNCTPYLKLRIIRIYPPYIIACAVLLPLSILFFNHDISIANAIKDILLLPRNGSPFITVAWTLKHEMLFYLLFMVFFLRQQIAWMLFICWGIAICSYQLFVQEQHYLANFLLNEHNLEFLGGLLIAYIVKRGASFHSSLTLFGAILFLITGIYEWKGFAFSDFKNYHLTYGASSCLILMGLTATDFKVTNKVSAFMLTLGKASYSLYLIHFAILSALIKLCVYFVPTANTNMVWLVLVILSTIAGIAYWRFIELPAIDRSKRMLGNPRLIKN